MLTVVCRWHAQMLVSCCVRDVIGEKIWNWNDRRYSLFVYLVPDRIKIVPRAVEKYVLAAVATRGGSDKTLLDMHRRKILYQQSRCGDDADGMRINERQCHVIRGGSVRRPCFRFLRVLEFPVQCRRVAGFDAALVARRFVGQRSQRHANICKTAHTVCHVTKEPRPTKSEE